MSNIYTEIAELTVSGLFASSSNDDPQYHDSLREWQDKLRPEQRSPDGDWFIWLIRAGRGWGKTLTGAFWTLQTSEQVPRLAIVAATYGDGRDYCIEGETGIKTICPEVEFNRSLGELTFPSGCKGKLFSAEEPDRMRGPNVYAFWCDEYAAWKYRVQAFKQLLLMSRKGDNLRGVITTTPKPGALKDIEARPTTVVTRGSTKDNIENLSPIYVREVIKPLEGTTLGKQEIDGLDIEDTPGALWKRESMIEAHRIAELPDLARIVVAVDPAASSDDGSDETGIVIAGMDTKGHGYVLDDMSLRASPHGWASEAIAAYSKYRADRIVYEKNNGGEMVATTLRTVSKNVPLSDVWASRGKRTRAEPVAALYEQGRVHHVGTFSTLEDQLCNWVPDSDQDSPDRLDAMVWALTELMLDHQPLRATTGRYA